MSRGRCHALAVAPLLLALFSLHSAGCSTLDSPLGDLFSGGAKESPKVTTVPELAADVPTFTLRIQPAGGRHTDVTLPHSPSMFVQTVLEQSGRYEEVPTHGTRTLSAAGRRPS